MPCFHPLLRQQQSVADPDSWKVFKIHDKESLNSYQKEISEGVSYSMLVPCGKCAGCRLDRAKEWTTRLIMEKSLFPDSSVWFLTFTYEHMPLTSDGLPTLVKKDVQDFFKRWRYYHGDFRYFLAGEYGDHTFRPHYHMIGYGMSFSDLDFFVIQMQDCLIMFLMISLIYGTKVIVLLLRPILLRLLILRAMF